MGPAACIVFLYPTILVSTSKIISFMVLEIFVLLGFVILELVLTLDFPHFHMK